MYVKGVADGGAQLINQEKQRFQNAILEATGDRERAAEILGLPGSTFFRKAKELGLIRTRRQRSMGFESSSTHLSTSK